MLRNGPRPAFIKGLPHNLRRQSSAASGSGISTLWKSSDETTDSNKYPNAVQQRKKGPSSKDAKFMNWRDIAPVEGASFSKKASQKKPVHRQQWKGPTSTKNPDTRLRDVILTLPNSIAESQDKQAFFAADADAGDEGLGEIDAPIGSFVVTRRNDIESFGVVIGHYYRVSRRHLCVLTATGELWLPFPTDVTFIIPSCVPINLAERCGSYAAVVTEKELNARMEVLKRVRTLIQELEAKHNSMCRFGVETYPKLRSKDPNAWVAITTGEVARMVENNPRYATVYAIHRHLMNNPLYFVARDPFILAQTFDVRPQNEVDNILKVLDWKRTSDPRLLAFAEKAKGVIAETTKRLQESVLEPPSETATSPVWSSDDQIIITFLVNSLRQIRSNQRDPYLIARVAILRLLDPTTPYLEDKDVLNLLVNLGVFSPWQDIAAIQKHLDVEAEPNVESPRLAKQQESVQRSLTPRTIAPNAPLGPDDFYPTDPLEIVRHDFGQLPVFVIDAADAKELDDGISVERIPSEPGSYWVHAHIANPTASLPPTHALAIDAMNRGTAQYFIHHSIPLFPKSITHHPDLGWSLGSQEGKPSRVMTFSAKLDSSGEIVDYKVRAGLVNNIRILSYEAVNQFLGCDDDGLLMQPFGGPLLPGSPANELATMTSLPEPEKEDIKLLNQIADTVRESWVRNNVVRFNRWSGSVGFGEFPVGSMTPTLQYRQFQGFPIFNKYEVSSSDLTESGAYGMVGEVMKIAGRVGSRFALDHNLPLIRRGGQAPLFNSLEHQEALRAKRTKHGYVFPYQAAAHTAGSYPAEYSLEPKAHYFVGAQLGEGYARTTSPLRRSLDLVSHWQFHRALLGSHADSSAPRFDADWMDDFRVSFAVAERARKRASVQHNLYWQGMFIDKWMKGELKGQGFIDPDPGAVYEGYIMDEGQRSATGGIMYQVDLPKFGIGGKVEGLQNGHQPDTKIMLRVKTVRFGVKTSFDFEFVSFA